MSRRAPASWFTFASQRPSPPTRRLRSLPHLEVLEDRSVPSTLTVLNVADHGAGSLRGTIAAAHNGDTIKFANNLHDKAITLTTGELAIDKSLSIQGLGARTLTVSGNDASRVFNVAGNASVTITDLTIAHGRVSGELAPGSGMGGGGAILNQAGAHLTLARDTLVDNRAVRDVGAVEFTVVGGALLNLGTATVLSSQFSSNQAVGGGANDAIGGSAGGAIDNFGGPDGAATLTVADTTFNDNRALAAAVTGSVTYYGVGGALDSNGGLNSFDPVKAQTSTAVITNCAFLNNLASGGAGAVGNGGAIDNLGEKSTMTVVGSVISGNRSVGGGGGGTQGIGGGLMNGGGSILNVVGCAITGNLAFGGDNGALTKDNPYASGAYGGGIANNFNGNDGRGILNISGSQIADNIARGGSETTGPGGIGVGGGITNSPSAIMLMTDCVVARNSAIGGHGGPGVNTLLAAGQQAGFGFGGGIDISNGGSSATIIDSVITANQAIGGAGGSGNNGGNGYGGGVGVAWDAVLGVTAGRSSLTLITSDVSKNQAVGGQGGTGADGGHGLGGGLYLSTRGSATVSASVIERNDADGGRRGAGGHDGEGHGGGVSYADGSMFAADLITVIRRNRASTSGNDIYVQH